jgi:hypothetical protein
MVELVYLAKLAGLTFAEVPIYFAERTKGDSKMSFRIQLEAAWRVWQLRGIIDRAAKPLEKMTEVVIANSILLSKVIYSAACSQPVCRDAPAGRLFT